MRLPAVDIRKVPKDLAGLDALMSESEAQGFEFLKRIPGLVAADAAYLDSEKSFVLGAYDGPVLIAIGGISTDPYIDDPELGRVRHVYVADAHRKRGVGRVLLRALWKRALLAYERIRLRAITPTAFAFYESLGYHRIADPNATHARTLGLTGNIALRIDEMFPSSMRGGVTLLLRERCGTGLPLCDDAGDAAIDRIRFAVLKLSRGNMMELERAVEIANIDWRDVLVAAEHNM